MKLLREPLLHFLLIGAAFFFIYGAFSRPDSGLDEKTVTVSSARIEWLKSTWQQRWNRPPTQDELDGLINSYVREIILYREALALGLDKDDTIIRRRLGTKMEFLVTDMLAITPPADDILKAWFEANRERYQLPRRFTFTQVFFDPEKRAGNTLEDAKAVKARLIAAGSDIQDPGLLGDNMMLANDYTRQSPYEIEGFFGSVFAQSLAAMAPGQWYGPVPSGYGVHLVLIHEIDEPPRPDFAELRDRLVQDWTIEQTEKLREQVLDSLYDKYTIVIETTAADTGAATAGQ